MWKNNSVHYIYQKRDVYYFSRRVPKDLEEFYKSSKITLSLRGLGLPKVKGRVISFRKFTTSSYNTIFLRHQRTLTASADRIYPLRPSTARRMAAS